MRVLRLSYSFVPRQGGLEWHVFNLSRCQVSRGHKVSLLTTCEPPTECSFDVLQCRGPYASLEKGTVLVAKAIFLFVAFMTCLARRRTLKPDFVHGHGDVLEAFVIGILGFMFQAKSVLTIHGQFPQIALIRLLGWIGFGLLDGIITVSEPIATRLRPSQRFRLAVITSGVDMNWVIHKHQANDCPLKGQLPSDRKLILSLARLAPGKGIEIVLEAMKDVWVRQPEAHLIVAGDGPLRTELRRADLNFERVTFLGQVNHALVPCLLSRCYVLVLASTDSARGGEGTPTSVLEALASGVPVVASLVGGLIDVLRGEMVGMGVEPGDSSALGDRLSYLLDHPEVRNRMSANARQVGEAYSWETITGRVEEFFGEIAG